jgi:aryl-phospho-beta-D-glucosidase BglC (GH1 family)
VRFLLRIIVFLCFAVSGVAHAAVGDLVATLSVAGAPAGVTYTLSSNPNGYFAIQNGNQLVEAINTPAGTYSITLQATAPGFSVTQPLVLNYTGGTPPVTPGFIGVNFSGMENQYPEIVSQAEAIYYATRGITKFRLPIGWSQSNPTFGTVGIQPSVDGALDTTSTYLSYTPFGPNLILNSEAIGSSPWETYNAGSGTTPSFTANAAPGPFGGNDATLVTISRSDNGSASQFNQPFTCASATSFDGSIYLQANSSGDVGKVITLFLYSYVSQAVIGEKNITLTNGWVRFDTDGSMPAGSCQFGVGFLASDGSSVASVSFLAWGGMVNAGTTPAAYQPTVGGYLGAVDLALNNIHAAGGSALLDIHTYGNGPGGYQIGSSQVPCSAFANLWQQISAHILAGYAPAPRGYDLMNEPINGFNVNTLISCYQAAITAIRANGDTTPIYVEGVNFSGEWNWVSGSGQPYNNSTLNTLTDPLNKLVFSGHGYLNFDSSGTTYSYQINSTTPGVAPPGFNTSPTIGVTRITPFLGWGSSNGVKEHVGELGASNDALAAGGNDNYAAWNLALANTITAGINAGIEVDIWAAGPGFSPTYPAYLGPSSVSNPGVSDFSSAGLQSTLMVVLEQFSGYAGPQPTAYRVDLPVTVTSSGNPNAPIVTSVHYGTSGVASGNFAVRYNGVIPPGGCVVTPHAYLNDGVTSAGGTFTPATVPMPAGQNALQYFTYTASQSATIQIKTTNSCSWTDPPALGWSTVNDVYVANSIVPNAAFGMYLRYTPYIGPALLLQRASDNAQKTFGYTLANSAGVLGFDRVAIQTWAESNSIPIVTIYDQSPNGNNETCTGTLPTLNLNNAAGYPEIDEPAGITCTFNSQVSGQAAFSTIARMNETSGSAGGLYRIDQFNGPIGWGSSNITITNTGWVGSALTSVSAAAVGSVSLGVVANSYEEYGFTYSAGGSNGLKTYLNGTLNAQTTGGSTITGAFTGTQTGTSLTASALIGTLNVGDTIAGAGCTAETIVSGSYPNYVTNTSGSFTGQSCTGNGNNYTLNAAFGHTIFTQGYFQFGGQNFNGAIYNFEMEPGQTLTSGQIGAITTADNTYYSTTLPDTLPAVPPTVSGVHTNLPIYPPLQTNAYPFYLMTVTDSNSGSPTDSATITLSGASGTLSGSGISGSGPYTIAATTAANLTTTLRNAQFNPTANTPGNTTTFTIVVTSSAGNSTTVTPSTLIGTYVAEAVRTPASGSFSPGVSAKNMKGVNLSGGENTPSPAWPSTSDIAYYASKGFTGIRLPFNSFTLNSNGNYTALNAGQMATIKSILDYAQSQNMYVILDLHNYGGIWDQYSKAQFGYSAAICTGGVGGCGTPGTFGQDLFVDMWRRLSTAFGGYQNVIWGLMNEPTNASDVSAVQWQQAEAAAVNAIRLTGATQLVLLQGICASHANAWDSCGNNTAWASYTGDTASNFEFDVHQYFDSTGAGTSPVATANGSTILNSNGLTTWLAAQGYQATLTEFGVAPDPWYPATSAQCGGSFPAMNYWSGASPLTTNGITTLTNVLAYMAANPSQWGGWTYWAGGPNFPGQPTACGYAYSTEPGTSGEQPQTTVLQMYN